MIGDLNENVINLKNVIAIIKVIHSYFVKIGLTRLIKMLGESCLKPCKKNS